MKHDVLMKEGRPAGDSSGHKRLGLDGLIWLAVIAVTPIQQLLYVEVSPAVRFLPLAASLVSLVTMRIVRVRHSTALLLSALFVVAAGFVSGANSSRQDSLAVAVLFALLIAIAPCALAFQIRTVRRYASLMVQVFISVQTLSAIVGVLQSFGLTPFGFRARGGRINGLAEHPNVLGLMAGLSILVLLSLLWKRIGSRAGVGLLLLLQIYVLVLSGSLSSIIALAVGLIVYIFALPKNYRVLVLVYTIFASLLIVVVGPVRLIGLLPGYTEDRLADVLGQSGSGVASAQIRLQTYEFALNYLERDPFVGVGMDSMNQSTVVQDLVVHNYVLRAWFQGGVLLLVAMLLLTAVLVAAAFVGLRTRDLAPSATIFAMFGFALTSAFYTQSLYWLPLFVSLAFISERERANGQLEQVVD